MLSHPGTTNDIQQQHRQHRRLKSTPAITIDLSDAALDTPGASSPQQQQRPRQHQRAQSLDDNNNNNNSHPVRKRKSPDKPKVTNHLGSQDNRQQNVREAQPRSPIRPGHIDGQFQLATTPTTTMTEPPKDEPPDYFGTWTHTDYNPLMRSPSHHVSTPVAFSMPDFMGNITPHKEPHSAVLQTLGAPQAFDFPSFLDVDPSQVGLATGVTGPDGALFGEVMTLPGGQASAQMTPLIAPKTPTKPSCRGSQMLTPAATPASARRRSDAFTQEKPAVLSPSKKKSADGSAHRVTKRGSPRKQSSAAKGTATKRKTLPTPSASSSYLTSTDLDVAALSSLDGFDASSNLKLDIPIDNGSSSSYYSPHPDFLSTPQVSFEVSPEIQALDDVFSTPSKGMSSFEAALRSFTESSDSSSGAETPMRGASPADGASPSKAFASLDIGLSASIVETGVTDGDIATFIQAVDGKENEWRCIFPGCSKRFSRKENVRSHVQTHLGDRQYKCNHCQKCFVRQHDLKRHATIHTGVKPFPCKCGSSFARQDALTRHRQRGTCVGAFAGIVKKEVKRGRPRKHRPEMDDRRAKAARSRKHAVAMSTSSSSSGTSDFSLFPSPNPALDLGTSAELDFLTESLNTGLMGMTQDALLYTPPMSPEGRPDGCVAPREILDVPLHVPGPLLLSNDVPPDGPSKKSTGTAVVPSSPPSLVGLPSSLPVVLEENEEETPQAKRGGGSSEAQNPILAQTNESSSSPVPQKEKSSGKSATPGPADFPKPMTKDKNASSSADDVEPKKAVATNNDRVIQSSIPVPAPDPLYRLPMSLDVASSTIAQRRYKRGGKDVVVPGWDDVNWEAEQWDDLLYESEAQDLDLGEPNFMLNDDDDYDGEDREDASLKFLHACSGGMRELVNSPIRADTSLPSYGLNF